MCNSATVQLKDPVEVKEMSSRINPSFSIKGKAKLTLGHREMRERHRPGKAK